jgi:hypothetical protein
MILSIKSLFDQDDYGDLGLYLDNHPNQSDGNFITGNWTIRDDHFALAMKKLILTDASFIVPRDVDKLNFVQPYTEKSISEKYLKPCKLLKNKVKGRLDVFVSIFYYDPTEGLSRVINVRDFCSCGFHVVVLDSNGNTNILKRVNQMNYREFKQMMHKRMEQNENIV